MMPVGTPPNAIVFGTGLVRMPDMMKAGLWLNLAGILLIFVLTYTVFIPALDVLPLTREFLDRDPAGRSRRKVDDVRKSATFTPSAHRLERRHGGDCHRDDNWSTRGPDRQPPDRPSGP